MRNRQQVAMQVLGYAIERQEAANDAATPSPRYRVRCPRTGAVIAEAASLRMAKRLVVMHELREFSQRRKGHRLVERSAAA
jgi:hypothetical protein